MKTIVIVGGGAAGMMAAISASYGNHKVILLEKNDKLGKKLYITGKGRCNITNACPPDSFLQSVVTNRRFMYSSFSEWNNEDMTVWLNGLGLPTKVERGLRVFPGSDRSSDVIRVLSREMDRLGVDVRTGCRVSKLLLDPVCENDPAESSEIQDGSDRDHGGRRRKKEKKETYMSSIRGLLLDDGTTIRADAVILACGGKSYPSTGSDGSGYVLAGQAGHRIMDPSPSLVPFDMKETWCRDLSGLSLRNVAIVIKDGKKTIYEGFGEFLFTHFGVSGPLVLTASTCLGSCMESLHAGKLTLDLDFKPALTPEQLDQRYLREFDTYRNKKIGHVIERMLPRSLVPVFLSYAGMDEEVRVRDVSKKDRRRMVESMKGFRMHIKGIRGFNEAIITRGGVCVKEVDPKTMESRKAKRLYLAGELLDVDAVTGGFNLQIAWSTGYAAGKHAGEE